MPGHDKALEKAISKGQMIHVEAVRDLYDAFCREMMTLGDSVEVEAAPFETRFSGPAGMRVVVSPYRELFMVSVGGKNPVEIRVNDTSSCCQALDLALREFLAREAELLNY